MNEPEKGFMEFRKIRLASPEESRETSEFSVKNSVKTFTARMSREQKNSLETTAI